MKPRTVCKVSLPTCHPNLSQIRKSFGTFISVNFIVGGTLWRTKWGINLISNVRHIWHVFPCNSGVILFDFSYVEVEPPYGLSPNSVCCEKYRFLLVGTWTTRPGRKTVTKIISKIEKSKIEPNNFRKLFLSPQSSFFRRFRFSFFAGHIVHDIRFWWIRGTWMNIVTIWYLNVRSEKSRCELAHLHSIRYNAPYKLLERWTTEKLEPAASPLLPCVRKHLLWYTSYHFWRRRSWITRLWMRRSFALRAVRLSNTA